jgi:hypothetical protein
MGEISAAVVTQLGLSAVFLYIYFQQRNDNAKDRTRLQCTQDKYNDILVELVKSNVTAVTELKMVIDAWLKK